MKVIRLTEGDIHQMVKRVLIKEQEFINRIQELSIGKLNAKIVMADIHIKAYEDSISDNPEHPNKYEAGQRVHRQALILRKELERRKHNGVKIPNVTVGMNTVALGSSAKMG